MYSLRMNLGKRFPLELDCWIPTKRKFLAALVSLFHPLALTGPTLVMGKVFLQTLWKVKYPWHQILSNLEAEAAPKLLSELLTF